MTNRITLEEKLGRISRGRTATPELSRYAFERFCREPVIRALEEQFAFFIRTGLAGFCYEAGIPADSSLTFAKCASIAASRFTRHDNDNSPGTRTLINAFFYPFDEVSSFEIELRGRHHCPVSRSVLPSHLERFYDLLSVPFGDYCEIIRELDIPVRSRIFQRKTAKIKGFSDEMRLMDLFCELKSTVDPSYDPAWGINFNRQINVCDIDVGVIQFRELIEFFIVPAAGFYNRRVMSEGPGADRTKDTAAERRAV